MKRSVLAALLLAASTAGTACTTGGATGAGGLAPRRSSVITAEEIARSQTTTAFEAVRELRPQWLQARGPDLITVGGRAGAQLAIDDVIRGSLDELRAVHIGNIHEIRFIRASDATTRWGSGVQGGVIEIITRRRR
jgi:outer membrane receptor for ferrienterochelin and colicin